MKTIVRSPLAAATLAAVLLTSALIAADPSKESSDDSESDRFNYVWQALERGEITESAEPSSGASAATTGAPSGSASNAAELAKQAQNPVADLISLPFKMDWNFGGGDNTDGGFTMAIQPVVPQHLNDDWNWIHRGIIPVPKYQPGANSAWGLGDIQYEGFLTPAKPEKVTWGIGPYLSFPSGTDDVLTSGKFSAGPALLVLTAPGHWTVGGLLTQLWSYAGDDDREDVNQTAFQPIINYNIPNSGGLYLTSSPVMSYNWEAGSANAATIPLGGGIGKVFKIGDQHINANAQFFGYADKPEGGPDWTMQFQITFLFPE